MQPVYRLLLSAALVPCMGGFIPHPASARQTTLSGSVGTGYDMRDRTYEKTQTKSTNDDQQKIFISPTITLLSKGVHDSFNLQYTPSFNYDFIDDENTVNHSLSLTGQRMLTSRWSLSLSDHYAYSDDPDASTETSDSDQADDSGDSSGSTDTLSKDQTGRTYWTNAASIRSSYALFDKTSLGGGYTYSVLRNVKGSEGSDYDEYDKHAFSTDLTHGFNANWRSKLGLQYTRGLYDQPQNAPSSSSSSTPDLDQYGLNGGVDYVRSIQDFFPLQYNLAQTDYDGNTRRDTQAHEWSLGWNHAFDPQTSFSLGGGPSYAETQGLDGQWGYNAYLTLSKRFQHASYALQLSKRYDTNNFSGTDESGLTDTYSARATMRYQYSKDLGFDLFGNYSQQSQVDPQGAYRDSLTGVTTETTTGDNTYDKDIYEAGMGFRYAFGRWYTAGLKYSYYVSDGQLDTDQYDEHRLMFTLSAAKELWRW